jgi:hypothetical protein
MLEDYLGYLERAPDTATAAGDPDSRTA